MHPFFDPPTPHLFAHRGASGEAPGNTLAAFERAWAQGARYLETDCHATADGEIVLLHDDTLDATTDGQGPVRAHALRDLAQLDAGYRFSPDGGRSFPFRGQGLRIPRLVELLRAFPEALINLEVKQADPPIAQEVVRLLRREGAEARVLLAAGENDIMDALHALEPRTALGSSLRDILDFYAALGEARLDGFRPRGHALQIPTQAFGRDLVTAESLAGARAVGLRVHVWTVNDPAEMRRLLDLGVDGLMSDFPARLVAAAKRWAAER